MKNFFFSLFLLFWFLLQLFVISLLEYRFKKREQEKGHSPADDNRDFLE